MTYLGNTTITIYEAPLATDTRDNSLYHDWDHPIVTVVKGCMIEPMQLAARLQLQTNREREYAAAYIRVWMPPSAPVKPNQRLLINNQWYDIHGQPHLWYDLEGVASHWGVLVLVRSG